MPEPDSIIAELEDAVRSGSSEKRVSTLRQVTDLFLHGAERLSEDQIKVFDDVLCHLITRVETRAKAELSKRLATLDYAPPRSHPAACARRQNCSGRRHPCPF